MKTKLILTLMIGLWVLVIGAGLRTMIRYEKTAGEPGTPPASWPANSSIPHATDRPTLIMLVHPQCVCTRASIGELEKLMTRSQGKVRAYVLVLKPGGVADGWEYTDLWQSAARIPGVTVLRDDQGREAAIFHAATSGQTMLYGGDGRILFQGGITASRGHLGDNDGSDSLVSLINGSEADTTNTAVFGCSLGKKTAEQAETGAGHGRF